jgi:hypothetical protein
MSRITLAVSWRQPCLTAPTHLEQIRTPPSIQRPGPRRVPVQLEQARYPIHLGLDKGEEVIGVIPVGFPQHGLPRRDGDVVGVSDEIALGEESCAFRRGCC